MVKAVDILETTRNLVGGDRNVVHGDIKESFNRVARLWSEFLGHTITPEQVCWCMTLLKMARATSGTPITDHYIDAAGYAAIAGEVMEIKEKAPAVKQEPYNGRTVIGDYTREYLDAMKGDNKNHEAHIVLRDGNRTVYQDMRKQHAGIINYKGPRRRTTDPRPDLPYHYLGSEADLA